MLRSGAVRNAAIHDEALRSGARRGAVNLSPLVDVALHYDAMCCDAQRSEAIRYVAERHEAGRRANVKP